ncbi:MAG: ArsR/SmtB family transcription factor [Desulfatirhabdiaceae bacterium]
MKNTVYLLKALSDQNRLRVVAALLSEPELCACQIKELLNVTGATVSRHLALLIQAGIVGSRKDGKWVYYRLEKENPNFQELIHWLKREFENSRLVQTDRRMLDEIGSCDKIEMCRKQRRKSNQ